MNTKESIDLLKRTRADLMERARQVAREICEKHEVVTSREVFAAMKEEIEEAGVKGHFIAAVFTGKTFEWTGEWFDAYDYDGEVSHGPHRVKVWKLAA
jgi:hypothetical protein